MPFWSGIINDKGRHYDESGQTNIRHNSLNYFRVYVRNCYWFTLIGMGHRHYMDSKSPYKTTKLL